MEQRMSTDMGKSELKGKQFDPQESLSFLGTENIRITRYTLATTHSAATQIIFTTATTPEICRTWRRGNAEKHGEAQTIGARR
jgi:hypothetical protein